MISKNRYVGIDSYAVERIRYNAIKLTKSKYFSINDLEDLEQELTIELLIKLPSYDPQRSSRNTFITIILESFVTTLVRRASSKKRGEGNIHFCSLYDPAPLSEAEDQDLLLIDIIPCEQNFFGYYEMPHDYKIDVKSILKRLPPTLGELCELLQTMTITEISKLTQTPYWIIYNQIKKLRRIFISQGLENLA